MDHRKRLVAEGYNRIADRYLGWRAGTEVRQHYLARLLALVPPGGRVLELGCGAGIPVAAALAQTASVIGVDLSPRQIALARQNVPSGKFIVADMMDVELPTAHFDAIAAFFSITHVPRDQHGVLLHRIANWLRPGGVFVGSLGANSLDDDVAADWLGAPMFFSHFDAATNLALLDAAGLTLLEHAIVPHDEDGRTVSFLWVVAKRP
jgi:SAM-dependent methyltransferase